MIYPYNPYAEKDRGREIDRGKERKRERERGKG
jgi:hypothetical protein